MNSRRVFIFLAPALLAANLIIAQGTEHPPAPRVRVPAVVNVVGQWDAVITNASGIDVPFKLLLDRHGSGLRAYILNGSERLPFTSAALFGNKLRLALEQYDGILTANLAEAELRGEWVRQTSQGVKHYPFVARRSKLDRNARADWVSPSLAGEWEVTFETAKKDSPDRIAPARFQQQTPRLQSGAAVAEVEGTIAPVSGDYGLLAGTITTQDGKEPTFRLSRFDGIHIVLVAGEFLPDGTIRGKLNNQPFTGVRKLSADSITTRPAEPSAEAITAMKNADEPFRFSARDPRSGATVTQDDPRFKGKAYIVDIFGTWCPNCHDEAPVLQDLYKRYATQGLEIVGLAYEYVDDPARNARLLEVYRKKYGLTFPMLLAGTTDDGQIAKTLPQLQGFGAYPTTIFVGADGKVKKIHAGFSGPATGERFTEVKKRFDDNVRLILGQ